MSKAAKHAKLIQDIKDTRETFGIGLQWAKAFVVDGMSLEEAIKNSSNELREWRDRVIAENEQLRAEVEKLNAELQDYKNEEAALHRLNSVTTLRSLK